MKGMGFKPLAALGMGHVETSGLSNKLEVVFSKCNPFPQWLLGMDSLWSFCSPQNSHSGRFLNYSAVFIQDGLIPMPQKNPISTPLFLVGYG